MGVRPASTATQNHHPCPVSGLVGLPWDPSGLFCVSHGHFCPGWEMRPAERGGLQAVCLPCCRYQGSLFSLNPIPNTKEIKGKKCLIIRGLKIKHLIIAKNTMQFEK